MPLDLVRPKGIPDYPSSSDSIPVPAGLIGKVDPARLPRGYRMPVRGEAGYDGAGIPTRAIEALAGGISNVPIQLGQAARAGRTPEQAPMTTAFIEGARKIQRDLGLEDTGETAGWEQGVRAFPVSLFGALPGLIAAPFVPAAAPAIGAASAAGIFGLSEYDSFLEQADAQGIPRSVSETPAVKSAVIEGLGESVATALGFKFLKPFTPALGVGKKVGAVIKPSLGAVAKKGAMRFAKQAPVEIGTEMVQSGGETYQRKQAGIMGIPTPLEAAAGAVVPSLTMTGIFSVLAGVGNSAQRRSIRKSFENVEQPIPIREQAVNRFVNLAKEQGLSDADAEAFRQSGLATVRAKGKIDLNAPLVPPKPGGQPPPTSPPGGTPPPAAGGVSPVQTGVPPVVTPAPAAGGVPPVPSVAGVQPSVQTGVLPSEAIPIGPTDAELAASTANIAGELGISAEDLQAEGVALMAEDTAQPSIPTAEDTALSPILGTDEIVFPPLPEEVTPAPSPIPEAVAPVAEQSPIFTDPVIQHEILGSDREGEAAAKIDALLGQAALLVDTALSPQQGQISDETALPAEPVPAPVPVPLEDSLDQFSKEMGIPIDEVRAQYEAALAAEAAAPSPVPMEEGAKVKKGGIITEEEKEVEDGKGKGKGKGKEEPTAVSEDLERGKPGLSDEGSLEGVPRGGDGGAVGGGVLPTGGKKRGGGSPKTHGIRPEPRPSDGVGGADTVSVSERGGGVRPEVKKPEAPKVSKPPKPEEAKNEKVTAHNEAPGDFRLDVETVNVEQGGPVTKIAANIAAIKLLKQIESEQRVATPEEQKILARYTGWGGLKQAFVEKNWIDQLNTLLTEEEYDSAKASTPNAHYTSPFVISRMFDAITRMGFTGGRILEPSMGTGFFFGLMPEGIRSKSTLYGVEKDSISGRMARLLYPSADVSVAGFETVHFRPDSFDLVIGNVPFGDFPVFDQDYKSIKGLFIHNYFILRGLDLLRPGGLMAVITTSGTLDARSKAYIRKLFVERADLVSAVRLPSNTFSKIANTEVTTDILVFQKREVGAKPGGPQFINSVETFTEDNWRVFLNEYYGEHPGNMIGTLSDDTLHPGRAALSPDESNPLTAGLPKWVSTLPVDIFVPAEGKPGAVDKGAPVGFVPGQLFVDADGNPVMFDQHGKPIDLGLSKRHVPAIQAYGALRGAMREMLDAQKNNLPEAEVVSSMKKAEAAYKGFVSVHSHVTASKNKFLANDSSFNTVAATEEVYKGEIQQTEIFKKRVISPVEPVNKASTPEEALLLSIAESGKVNPDRIGALLGMPTDHAMGLLEESGTVFYLGDGQYEWAPIYLSGDVKAKARRAIENAKHNPRFQKNVDALTAVFPADRSIDTIDPLPGANWIPRDVLQGFVKHAFSTGFTVEFVEYTGTWLVTESRYPYASNFYSSHFSNPHLKPKALLLSVLNEKKITIRHEVDGVSVMDVDATLLVRELQANVKAEFLNFIKTNEKARVLVEKAFNDRVNVFVPMRLDASFMQFPEISKGITLWDTQKNGILRIIMSGNLYLAHAVGAGKTYSMIAAGMEMKRMGLVKKPVYLVLKSTVPQWKKAFSTLYPGKRVLTLSVENLTPASRKETFRRIMGSDWDAVVVHHNAFENMPLSPELRRKFYADEVDQIDEEIVRLGGEGRRVSRGDIGRLEKTKLRFEANLQRIDAELNERVAGDIYFDDLGIDYIFVDEANVYKNLYMLTQHSNVSGVTVSETGRSIDFYQKAQWLYKTRKGRAVTMASATPVSNSAVEFFTIMRYLAPDFLRDNGVSSFDSWMLMFGELISRLEISAEGGSYRNKERFSINVPVLAPIMSNIMDYRTTEELGLDVPPVDVERVFIDPPDDVVRHMTNIQERARRIKSGSVDKRVDNWLNLTMDARKGSLDMQLVDDKRTPSTGRKLDYVADTILAKWKEKESDLGTQLVIIDLSVPKQNKARKKAEAADEGGLPPDADVLDLAVSGGYSAYDELRAMLIARGVPAGEVAFIHGAKNDAELNVLYERVNNGDVRILLGSTEKVGIGVNIQKRLTAVHLIAPPWTPHKLQQVLGRIIRPGNALFHADRANFRGKVFFFAYKNPSFDEYMYQTLEHKAKMFNDALTGQMEITGKTLIDPTDALVMNNVETIKAIVANNPDIKRKAELEAEQRSLNVEKRQAIRRVQENKGKVVALKAGNATIEKQLLVADQAVEAAKAIKEGPFNGKIQSRVFGEEQKGDFYEALVAFAEESRHRVALNPDLSGRPSLVGSLGGFDLFHVPRFVQGADNFTLSFTDPTGAASLPVSVYISVSMTAQGQAQAMGNGIKNMIGLNDSLKAQLSKNVTDIEELSKEVGFDKQARLDAVNNELAVLVQRLSGKEEEDVIEDEAPEAEEERFSIPSSMEERIAEDHATRMAEVIEKVQSIVPRGTLIKTKAEIRELFDKNKKAFKDWKKETSDTAEVEIAGVYRVARLESGEIQSVITLSDKLASPATVYHEAWHAIEQLLASDEEIDIVAKKFGGSEARADAFAAFVKGEVAMAGSIVGRVRILFNRVLAFLRQLAGKVTAEDIFRQAFSGRMAEREPQFREEATAFKIPEPDALRKEIMTELKAIFDQKLVDIQKVKVSIAQYAKDHLPLSERGRVNLSIARATTPKQAAAIFARIDVYASKARARKYVSHVEGMLDNADPLLRSDILKRFPELTYDKKKSKWLYQGESMSILDESASFSLISEIALMKKAHKDQIASKKEIESQLIKAELAEIEQQGTAPIQGDVKAGFLSNAWTATQNILPMDVIIDMMDKGKHYVGVLSRILKHSADRKYGNFLNRYEDRSGAYDAILKEHGLTEDDEIIVGVWSVLKQEEDGRARLIAAGEEESFLDDLEATGLTPGQDVLYQHLRDNYDAIFPEMEVVMREEYGKPLGHRKNYSPYFVDFNKAEPSLIHEEPEKMFRKKTPEANFTKQRTKSGMPVKLHAGHVYKNYMRRGLYLIEMGPTINHLHRLVSTAKMAELAGVRGRQYLLDWLDMLARGGGSMHGPRTPWMDLMRRNIGLGVLAWKVSTALVQISALPLGASVIGGHYVATGLRLIMDPEYRAFARKFFIEVTMRKGINDPTIADMMDESMFGGEKMRKFVEWGMAPMRTMDWIAAAAVALGGYQRSLDEQGIEWDMNVVNEEALRAAQLAVRRTQSSPYFKDMPGIFFRTTSPSFWKLILQFQSFALNEWSLIKHDMWDLGIAVQNYKQAGIILFAMAASFVMETGLRDMAGIMTGRDDRDDEDDAAIIAKFLKNMLHKVPVLGQALDTAVYREFPAPAVRVIKDLGVGAGTFLMDTKEGELNRNAAMKAITNAAILVGVPGAAQAGQLVRDNAMGE